MIKNPETILKVNGQTAQLELASKSHELHELVVYTLNRTPENTEDFLHMAAGELSKPMDPETAHDIYTALIPSDDYLKGILLMQLVGSLATAEDEPLTTAAKKSCIDMAEAMGPDWAQALYNVAVRITRS